MASNANGNAVMMAKLSGVCACGGTVGKDDMIAYDREARKVVRCYGCGLDIGGHAWKFKGVWTDGANHVRRTRAAAVAAARLSIARWETRLAAATTADEIAKVTRRLNRSRAALAEAEVEAKGGRGEVAWARPSARDIELAMERAAAEAERRTREEAEENAA